MTGEERIGVEKKASNAAARSAHYRWVAYEKEAGRPRN